MLRVVSVNIEGKKHLDSVIDFLKTERPEVLCLQEAYENDIKLFSEVIGEYSVFVPMNVRDGGVKEGIAIVSKYPFTSESEKYAGSDLETVPVYDNSSFIVAVMSQWYQLLVSEVSAPDGAYTIATTHLPVTERGEVTDYQLEAISNLINKLERVGEFVLLGDMNAPRGQQSFSLLAQRYKDNISSEYQSSLDPVLHRAPTVQKSNKMVDGCFSTPSYTIKQMRFQCGISDHCAICVEVTKNL